MKIINRLYLSIMRILSIILVLLLCFSYGSSFFSPEVIGEASMLWFAFPYLWLACAIVTAIWLIFRPRLIALIPITAMLVTFDGVLSIANFGPTPTANGHEIKILTFNVGHTDWNNVTEFTEYINSQNADILCFQEMNLASALSKAGAKSYKEIFPEYKYAIGETVADGIAREVKTVGSGQVILSKYPIEEYNPIELDEKFQPLFLGVIVTVDDSRRFALCNVHLESIKLQPQHISAVNHATRAVKRETARTLLDTYRHLRRAFDVRAEQVRKLVECQQVTDMPLVVCGDFNDTPISYTYHTVSSILIDSFREAHGGFGDTYNGDLPPLRIDYVFHSHSFKCVGYEELDVDLSDHLPVSCKLVME